MRKLAVILLVLSFALAACGSNEATNTPAGTGGGAQNITVDLNEWEVAPKDLKVKAGKITFDVKNTGKFLHSLAIEGGGVKQESQKIKGGENTKLEVDLKPGTYKTWCPVGNHEEQGMVGELVVE